MRHLLLATLALLVTAPAALAAPRAGEAGDAAGDGQPGRDLVGASATFDPDTGTMQATFRSAAPFAVDDALQTSIRFGVLRVADGQCVTPPSGILSAFTGNADPSVFVGGNATTDLLAGFSTSTGTRAFSADRTSVTLTGSDARLRGLGLDCVAEAFLFDFPTKFTPDRLGPFTLLPVQADTDGDGFVDGYDLCPAQAGGPPRGCPAVAPPATPETPPGAAPAPAAPPADTTAPRAALAGLATVAGRTVTVRVRCDEACTGRVRLRTTRGRLLVTKGFAGAAGKQVPVRLRAARRLGLRSKVVVEVVVTDAAGNAATTTQRRLLR